MLNFLWKPDVPQQVGDPNLQAIDQKLDQIIALLKGPSHTHTVVPTKVNPNANAFYQELKTKIAERRTKMGLSTLGNSVFLT